MDRADEAIAADPVVAGELVSVATVSPPDRGRLCNRSGVALRPAPIPDALHHAGKILPGAKRSGNFRRGDRAAPRIGRAIPPAFTDLRGALSKARVRPVVACSQA